MLTQIKDNIRALLVLPCHCCGLVFLLCSRCYRGHRYCCSKCRTAARRQAAREAQRRYRQTDKGKKAHCDAEKRRRMGRTEERKGKGMITETPVKCCVPAVMYALSVIDAGIRTGEKGHCHFCGCPGVTVNKFSRTYAGKTIPAAGGTQHEPLTI